MSLPDAEANDEYMLCYTHRGMKLSSVYWTYSDNREKALRAAAATARSDGVENLRVFRRPKVAPWEPVDWRTEVRQSGPGADERDMESYAAGGESG
jgi:hypothetical protein